MVQHLGHRGRLDLCQRRTDRLRLRPDHNVPHHGGCRFQTRQRGLQRGGEQHTRGGGRVRVPRGAVGTQSPAVHSQGRGRRGEAGVAGRPTERLGGTQQRVVDDDVDPTVRPRQHAPLLLLVQQGTGGGVGEVRQPGSAHDGGRVTGTRGQQDVASAGEDDSRSSGAPLLCRQQGGRGHQPSACSERLQRSRRGQQLGRGRRGTGCRALTRVQQLARGQVADADRQ